MVEDDCDARVDCNGEPDAGHDAVGGDDGVADTTGQLEQYFCRFQRSTQKLF